MAQDFHVLAVAGIVQETPDARSFIFRLPPELREKFRYKAGQFLTFEIPWNGITIRRSYSLASSPETDPWPKVTVKRVKAGRASNWFNDVLHVGDTLRVLPPEGRFVLKQGEMKRPLALLGAGSGITPVLSLLKSALLTTQREVTLVYANRDEASIIFRDELDMLGRIFGPRLRVHHHLDSRSGFLTAPAVQQLLGACAGADYYVCGPTAFMDTVESALELLGVRHADRFIERYSSPIDSDRRAAEPPPPEPTGDAPATFEVTLEGKTHTVPYQRGATLLQAATAAGVSAPSSCEDGYCGCCMAFKRSGTVTMATHEALTEADVRKGWVLPCQAKAAGPEPLVIDFDEKY